MWDPPGPGLEPVCPALAGGFLTTAPPGKSLAVASEFPEKSLIFTEASQGCENQFNWKPLVHVFILGKTVLVWKYFYLFNVSLNTLLKKIEYIEANYFFYIWWDRPMFSNFT